MRIGYATGVFDLFHVGHLNLLRAASKQVDYLVVGVSTDTLARTYKSKSPVIPMEERIEIVQSLRFVDRVVIQTDLNKLKAWAEVKFDVLFVGSDWKGSQRWSKYEEQLQEVGAKIIYLPYTEQTSSSGIIKKIQQMNLGQV